MLKDQKEQEDKIGPCPTGSRSGRTAWMIRHLVEAVKEGQPKSAVLCENMAHMDLMRLIVKGALYEAGVFYDAKAKNLIELEGGATILFVVRGSLQSMWLDSSIGVFSDHWTEGEE